MAKITIDGKEWEFEEGMNLFDACTIARGGEKLPHFCYHPGLPVAGVCRMCQVEIEGVPKLLIACNATVRDGMVVRTRTERIDETVRQILGFHLLHHPVDCPICDQVGECALQNQYMRYGLYEGDEDVEDKLAKTKAEPIGPYVMLDAERCVLCARCTRFTDFITKTHELGIFNRGDHSEIGVAPGLSLENNYSLNTVDLCPVGALTSRDFRFQKRVYRLSTTDGVCPGCATGCNMEMSHNDGTLYRYQPRENHEVNGYWMCDRGRLLYHEAQGEGRIGAPLVRSTDGESKPAPWDRAYAAIETKLDELGDSLRLVLVGSPHATVEELYALSRLLGEGAGGAMLGHRLLGSEMGEADELLLSADRTPNHEGARRLGLGEFNVEDLAAAGGEGSVLVVLGNDLAGLDAAAARALDGFEMVIYVGTRRDATSELASVVLPGLMYTEKDGTFVNKDGRAQRIHAAVEGPGTSREDWRIIAELGELLGHAASWRSWLDVASELSVSRGEFMATAGGLPPLGRLIDSAAEVQEVERG